MKKIIKESVKSPKVVSAQLIGDKIKEIMAHYGYSGFSSLKRFADITKISSQNIDAVITGKTKNPTIIIAAKVLAAFPDVNARWLLLDDPNMFKVTATEASKPVDFTPKLESDAALQKRVAELEEVLKSKEKIIDLQDQLLAKCK